MSPQRKSIDDAIADVIKDTPKVSIDDAIANVLGTKDAPKDESNSRTWADSLPMVGGAIGGIAGGPVGAAMGGAAGEGYKQLAQRIGEIPGAVVDVARNLVDQPAATLKGFVSGSASGAVDAGVDAAKQGALQAGGAVVGGVMKATATPLMRAALGNTEAVLARRPDVAATALKVGPVAGHVSRTGLLKLDDMLAQKLGLADRAALQATRDAVAAAWKKLKPDTIFGNIAHNSAFLSAMAQGLYHSAAAVSGISPQVIRAAVLAAGSQMEK